MIERKYQDYNKYYKKKDFIDNGGYGSVHKGIMRKTNEPIAIKIINLEKIREALLSDANTNVNGLDKMLENYIKGFEEEFNIMKTFSQCSNSVQCYDYFINNNSFIIIMELCDKNLLKLLTERFTKTKKGFQVGEIFEIMKQLNNAFKIMYDNKIIHRDLKLENILIKNNKEQGTFTFKLTDYGTSTRTTTLSKNLTYSLKGTVPYMAPELLNGQKFNSKCDLWSLGIILYRLFFYKPPFVGDTEIALINNINFSVKNKLIAKSNFPIFDDLIQRLLEIEPEKRLDWKGYFSHPFFKRESINKSKTINFINGGLKLSEISGILYLFLLKSISGDINDLNKINNIEIRNIIQNIKKENKYNKNLNKILTIKLSCDIINYSSYISSLIKENEINNLISLLNENQVKRIIELYMDLIKFKDANNFFEKEFIFAQVKSYFDYSLISVTLNLENKIETFLKKLNKCPNCIPKCLFHGTKKEIVDKILKEGYLYSKRTFFGMGVYFTDMLDYVIFYCGGKSDTGKGENWGKIIPVNNTFSFVGNIIYYDKKKKKDIYDGSYYEKQIENNPTYEEIKNKYPEKMIEKNGINTSKIDLIKGRILKKNQIDENEKLGNILGTDYAITEMEQIFPLYGLTLKRNEFLVIWKNYHFGIDQNYTNFLNEAKFNIIRNFNINVYIENSAEKALQIIKTKKFNKIILISDMEKNIIGKKFVEDSRKILGFPIMVLFFSLNINIPKWIENFPNALYSNKKDFYLKYIYNYNIQGLYMLKNEVEKNYNLKLYFTLDFLSFNNFIESGTYEKIYFNELSSGKLIADEIKEKKKDNEQGIDVKDDDNPNILYKNK